MIYLIIAIVFSSMISIILKVQDKRIKNNMAMFMANYVVCVLLSLCFIKEIDFSFSQNGMPITILLGLVGGILYLANFIIMQINIRKNGAIMAGIFTKLGVVITTLMAIFIFKEIPTILQIIGIILVLLAIIVINFSKGDKQSSNKNISLLLVLVVCSGFAESMTNVYDKLGTNELKDHFLLFTFGFAFICALIVWLKQKQSITVQDILTGVLIGIPNYFSARFILLALNSIQAIVVYPVYSVGTIAIISVVGSLLLKEKLSLNKIIGIIIICIALVLLNM